MTTTIYTRQESNRELAFARQDLKAARAALAHNKACVEQWDDSHAKRQLPADKARVSKALAAVTYWQQAASAAT